MVAPPKVGNGRSRPAVLIASPSAKLRKRWSKSLPGNIIIHEVGDRTTLNISIEKLSPSVVLLDNTLLRPSNTRNLAKLHELGVSAKIILFSKSASENEGISALKAGAKGYCHKNIKPVLLRKAVEKVQMGEVWIGRRLIASLIEDFCRLSYEPPKYQYSGGKDHMFNSLTRREIEVARFISAGARNKEISSRLGVSEKTVKAHLTAIFKKLGISDRLSLALFLVANAPVLNQSMSPVSKAAPQIRRPTSQID